MGRLRQMAILALLTALVSVVLLRGEADGEAIYVCRRPDGSPIFTNIPEQCGIVRERRENAPQSFSVNNLVRAASRQHGVDTNLIRALIKVESDFNPTALSPKGAMGLMQLMPDTARLYNTVNAYDAGENIDAGVRHLRYLLNYFQGELRLVLAAYNAGIGAVERYRGIPPYPETRQYVTRVLGLYNRYRSSDALP
jgi:soluble lytic murein transglycosylase-like protein